MFSRVYQEVEYLSNIACDQQHVNIVILLYLIQYLRKIRIDFFHALHLLIDFEQQVIGYSRQIRNILPETRY